MSRQLYRTAYAAWNGCHSPRWLGSFDRSTLDHYVIEEAEQHDSLESFASRSSGNLLLLQEIIGVVYQLLFFGVSFGKGHLVKAREWKGQLPKAVTQTKMESFYGTKFETDHESDAVGIADWFAKRSYARHKGTFEAFK